MIPLVFLTAWEGLIDRAKIQAKQRILVQGGAGGVGHMAVQIARAYGAEVFATVTEGKRQIVESYGATAIDYTTMKVDEYVIKYTQGVGFDVVYDTVGGQTLANSIIATRPYGHVLSCRAFGTHDLTPASLRCLTLSGIFVLLPMLSGQGRAHHGEILRQATKLVEAGKVKPLVDERRFSLADVHTVHELVTTGKVMGKAVIEIGST